MTSKASIAAVKPWANKLGAVVAFVGCGVAIFAINSILKAHGTGVHSGEQPQMYDDSPAQSGRSRASGAPFITGRVSVEGFSAE